MSYCFDVAIDNNFISLSTLFHVAQVRSLRQLVKWWDVSVFEQSYVKMVSYMMKSQQIAINDLATKINSS